MNPREQKWVESYIGKRIDVRPWTNGSKNRLKGTVIDYKADLVGMGVFFICQLDSPNRQGDTLEESYRAFPSRLNQRVRDSQSIRHQTTNDAKKSTGSGAVW